MRMGLEDEDEDEDEGSKTNTLVNIPRGRREGKMLEVDSPFLCADPLRPWTANRPFADLFRSTALHAFDHNPL